MGKKAGFSLAELNELRIRDLVDFAEIRLGLDGEGRTAREPTQADIDALFGR